MRLFGQCCSGLARLSRAAAKAASAKLRSAGFARQTDPQIQRARLNFCQTCPLATVTRKGVHCGRPLLQHVARDPSLHGCGCPIAAKSADPTEHCPIDRIGNPATQDHNGCTCKWCASAV